MSTTGKLIVALVLAVLVVVVLVILPKPAPQEPSAPAGEPIKLGFIGPLTGDGATYGEPFRNVVQLAVEEINGAGGVAGRLLAVIYEDGKCNGKDGANAAQKLVNVDKVQVILGGFCSSESLAAVPIAAAGKVFLFSPGSSSPDLTGVSPFFARNYPSDATQGEVLAKVAYQDKEWRTVAFLQEQLDYPLGIYKAFLATYEPLGGKVVKEEFPSGATDFRSQLIKLRAAKPDALFIDVQTAPAGERILKQLQELKWNVPLLVSDVMTGDAGVVAASAAALEGALAAEFGVDPANPKFQHLLSAYQAKYAVETPYQSYAQTAYDAVYLLKDGLTAVGEDGEKLAQWIRTVNNWSGAAGAATIKADGDPVGGHVPKIIKSGKVEIYIF